MTQKTQKKLSAFFVGCATLLGFQSLVYIVNLNQTETFLKTAFWVWLYLSAMILVFFDLHFKTLGGLALARKKHESVGHKLVRAVKIFFSALNYRLSHYFRIKEMKTFLVYLVLPSFLFWFTVAVFYSNMGRTNIQQLYAWISTLSMVVVFWYLKEVFHRKTERVDSDIFAVFSVAKIYTLTLAYSSGLVLMRRYCLQPKFYAVLIFAVSFLLIYQALFQHGLVKIKHLASALGISAVMGVAGYLIYTFWGLNYFSAAIFMAAIYNLMWGSYHYHLDHGLNRKVFFEILIICFAVAFLVFVNTNFKERILGSCM